MVLWLEVGFAVGIYHEATAILVGAVGESQEAVPELMQDDFPELGLVLHPESRDDAVRFIHVGES